MADVTVLLIQAEGPRRAATLEALAVPGHAGQVAAVANGQAALEFLRGTGEHSSRSQARQPRLLLVDLPLPDGLRLLDALKAEPSTAGLPVIALVEPDESGARDAWYRGGANSVVFRSPDAGEMQRKMQRLRDFWEDANVANRASRV